MDSRIQTLDLRWNKLSECIQRHVVAAMKDHLSLIQIDLRNNDEDNSSNNNTPSLGLLRVTRQLINPTSTQSNQPHDVISPDGMLNADITPGYPSFLGHTTRQLCKPAGMLPACRSCTHQHLTRSVVKPRLCIPDSSRRPARPELRPSKCKLQHNAVTLRQV